MHRSNNINGINADPNGNGYGTETQIWPLPRGVWAIQQAYIRKVVDTVNDLDNVLYEVSNESTSASTQWQYEVIKYVNSYQQTKPQQHPVGMTMRYGTQTAAGDQVLFDSPATWISPADDPEYDANPPAATGRKVLIPDTDHLCGDCLDRTWVWKSFLRGMNPIFMDLGIQRFPASTDSRRQGARNAMGDTRRYADRMDLAAMTPQNSLSSTGYVLARQGSEYLVYQPGSGSFQVTLVAGTYDYEWFNPSSGTVGSSGRITVTDGARSFSPSFSGTAVLYLKRAAS